ncbi:phosphatase PAP2 family protein [Rhizobium halophilum]|uniref:phosphatase PAP2 family protein n=1 Tax=Rhizobium halophilum TaxID=2846852 RepID=UPI00374DA840
MTRDCALERSTHRSIRWLAIGASAALLIALERNVAFLVRQFPEKVRAFFALVSSVTEPVLVLPLLAAILAIALLRSGKRGCHLPVKVAAICLISGTCALVLALLGKVPLGRARPQITGELDPLVFKPFGGSAAFESLPSAQAATTAAICICLATYAPRSRLIVLPCMVLIGLSRVVIERHWVSDVVAGWMAGWLAASMTLLLFRRMLGTGERGM